MSGFSAEWLSLREAADHRSRDAGLLAKLASALGAKSEPEVVDLGCGTGSNLRATAPALGAQQSWTLVDHDEGLLAAARESLASWADNTETSPDRLILHKNGRTIRVRFRKADLSRELDLALGASPDLVTASALFDLCSVEFIDAFARAVAARRALFYTVLTYNGVQTWSPAHAADANMRDAFHAHQSTDKGFGRSAGPQAPRRLAEAFSSLGYRVDEADTPWLLDEADGQLLGELQAGFAGAVLETGTIAVDIIRSWTALRRTGSVVGHTDTLATP